MLSRFTVNSIVHGVWRSDVIDYLIRPLGVQYNKGCLEMWPSQIVEDSPRFMSQLRASVASPDRRIIPWFKLGKYWSLGLQWLALRPEMEGNGLLCRVQKKRKKKRKTDEGKNKIHYLNDRVWWHTERKTDGFQSCSFLSVNSSHRNVGGFKCRLSSFIKASAPPAFVGINLDNIATYNRTLWRIMWWRRVIPGTLFFSVRHHLVFV